MNIPANYLALEPLILARIAAQLTVGTGTGKDLAKVGGVAEFEFALENDGPFPSAYVLYADDDVEQKGFDGRRMMVTQRWQVALLVRPSITTSTGAASLVAAGTVLSKLVNALTGWTPAGGYQAMKRIKASGQSVVYANGMALFVLDFEVGLPLTMGTIA